MSNSETNLTKIEVMVQVGGTGFQPVKVDSSTGFQPVEEGSTGFQPVEDIEALRQRAYLVMKDVESYSGYMPSVNEVKILKQEGNLMTTRWDAEIGGAPITWIQEVESVDESQEMIFEAVEGDFDVFRGRWSVAESDGRVELKLLIEYRLGIPVIENILRPILKKKIKANSELMLQALAAQVGK